MAGPLAFVIFAVGIIRTGLLAIPVLAGSAAYAMGEARHWPIGLSRKPNVAKAFYAAIAIATLLGSAIVFSPLDPIKALVWSAVINGMLAAPVTVLLMLMSVRGDSMGSNAITGPLRWIGWVATGVMAIAVVAMVVTSVV